MFSAFKSTDCEWMTFVQVHYMRSLPLSLFVQNWPSWPFSMRCTQIEIVSKIKRKRSISNMSKYAQMKWVQKKWKIKFNHYFEYVQRHILNCIERQATAFSQLITSLKSKKKLRRRNGTFRYSMKKNENTNCVWMPESINEAFSKIFQTAPSHSGYKFIP